VCSSPGGYWLIGPDRLDDVDDGVHRRLEALFVVGQPGVGCVGDSVHVPSHACVGIVGLCSARRDRNRLICREWVSTDGQHAYVPIGMLVTLACTDVRGVDTSGLGLSSALTIGQFRVPGRVPGRLDWSSDRVGQLRG
jgi:hypothetical protein